MRSEPARRVCLVTPAHLSTNPRLVKEADTLAEAGYDVRVFACQYVDWAEAADRTILERAQWRSAITSWHPKIRPFLFWKSRLRQHACRRILKLLRPAKPAERWHWLVLRAYDRVLPELLHQVLATPADLYIAHNLAALPLAVTAAVKHEAKLGFDAEDLHSGIGMHDDGLGRLEAGLTRLIEQANLPRCDYVTAGSPGIADAYGTRYRIPPPVPVLNVFPLSQRPQRFQLSDPHGPMTVYWMSQSIGAHRGLEDVVAAIGSLAECNIELHLRGRWQPGYADRFFRLAMSKGLQPAKIVHHAPAPPDSMVVLASQFDVGLAVEPGRDENNDLAISNKLCTYLLAGNAVIATSTKGQQPVMDTIGDAGFCYRPGDVGALRRHLRFWYEDRPALERARRHAWDWGTRRYNWDVEKEKFLRVVKRALHAPSAGALSGKERRFSQSA